MEIEHYGDSLESHPDYLFMKKMWMEDLEKVDESLIFVDPPKFKKEELFKGINVTLKTTEYEENILRGSLGTGSQREDDRQVDLRRETS
jgi:AMMECR1 domain-containing protein